MKINIAILAAFTFLISLSASCQISPLPSVPDNWTRLIIKDIGNIDLPPTLELQNGNYKAYNESFYTIMEVDAPEIVAQQVGLNDLTKAGISKYARVLINTTIGADQEFEPLFFDINSISAKELAEINHTMRSEIETQFVANGVRLVQWFPVTLEKLNGMSCMHMCFRRQIEDKPIVIVDSYLFFNNDRRHKLTLSYRESEAYLWEADFLRILESFRITKIR
jgi:hypothetical protein